MCEKPPVWWAWLHNVAENNIVSVGNIEHFLLLQNSKFCQKLSDSSLQVAAIRIISCEIASAVCLLCAMFRAHS